MNLKDSWNAFNVYVNYLPHGITSQCRIRCFEIKVLIVQALAQHLIIALSPSESSLSVLMWRPPWAPCRMQSLNICDPTTAVKDSILRRKSKTSVHYSTLCKRQPTMYQYTTAHGCFWRTIVITRYIYPMNNCTQWSSVFTMAFRFKLRV